MQLESVYRRYFLRKKHVYVHVHVYAKGCCVQETESIKQSCRGCTAQQWSHPTFFLTSHPHHMWPVRSQVVLLQDITSLYLFGLSTYLPRENTHSLSKLCTCVGGVDGISSGSHNCNREPQEYTQWCFFWPNILGDLGMHLGQKN